MILMDTELHRGRQEKTMITREQAQAAIDLAAKYLTQEEFARPAPVDDDLHHDDPPHWDDAAAWSRRLLEASCRDAHGGCQLCRG